MRFVIHIEGFQQCFFRFGMPHLVDVTDLTVGDYHFGAPDLNSLVEVHVSNVICKFQSFYLTSLLPFLTLIDCLFIMIVTNEFSYNDYISL